MSLTQIFSNNEWYELKYNENLLLLSNEDIILITLYNDWKFEIHFIYDDSIEPLKAKFELPKSDTIVIYLNKWDSSSSSIENTGPWYFESKDKKNKFFIKLKTQNNLDKNFRNTNISIWEKI